MNDLTPFEQRLVERLARELDRGDLAFDADRTAATAMVPRRPLDRVLNRLALGPMPIATARKAALVAVAAVLALVTIALAVGVVRPGGSRLAFIRQNGDVVLANGDGSAQSVIYQVESPVLFTQLALAPDGKHLAVVDESLQLAIMDRTGEVTFSAKMEAGFNRFAWSPDGQRLAIFDGPWLPRAPGDSSGPVIHPDLEIVGLDGSIEWAVPLSPDFRYGLGQGALAWSPDGQSIVITGAVDAPRSETSLLSSLWIVDIGERTVRQLPSGEPAYFPPGDTQPAWLPDGSLVYARYQSGIWQIDPRSGTSRRVFEIPRVCHPNCFVNLIVPSPDGSRLLIDDPAQGFAILDLATGVSTPVRAAGNVFPRTFRWAADGKSLVFLFGATALDIPSLVAIDIATGDHRVLATGTGRFFDYLP